MTFDRVTGYAATAAGDTHAFVDHGVAMQDLGTLGGSFSDGYGINEAGPWWGSQDCVGEPYMPSSTRTVGCTI